METMFTQNLEDKQRVIWYFLKWPITFRLFFEVSPGAHLSYEISFHSHANEN